MPMGAAALAGVAANGHRWKYEIRIAAHASAIGEFDNTTSEEDIERERTAIVTKTRAWLAGLTKPEENDIKHDIENKVDDLEMVDADLDEVRFSMNYLYDDFDFYRVVAV
jgi:hypothetical protein